MRKKIKLVVSDLHLGTGAAFEGGYCNPLEEFNYDEKFAEFLEHYSCGGFEDHDVELILNGDIFNLLQVDYRGHYLTVITEDITLEKMEYIIKGHQVFFNALAKFCEREGNVITFIVGNHDQGMLWPKVRAHLDEALNTRVQYKNIAYFFDGFHIEHGHMYEAANRLNPKKFFLRKNLPEPILNLPIGSFFFLECVLKLKESQPHIDKVKPLYRMMRWGMLNEPIFTLKAIFIIYWYFISLVLFHKSSPYREMWSLSEILRVVLAGKNIYPDLTKAARTILSEQRVHTVIFGHSHVYKYRQLDEGEYFNTGTWTDITSLDMGSLGRLSCLTYVLIEYPQTVENNQPRAHLKHWIGYHRVEEDIMVS